jgi:putative transposase
MHHSAIGEIANQCWIDIPKHFPFVKLDAHIIMPNHTHGIIIIDKSDLDLKSNKFSNPSEVQTQNIASLRRETNHDSNSKNNSEPKNKFGPQSQNLASIIRGFKTGVTVNARKIKPSFEWQARFHDVIIRDHRAYTNIRNYIINNPANWDKDSLK